MLNIQKSLVKSEYLRIRKKRKTTVIDTINSEILKTFNNSIILFTSALGLFSASEAGALVETKSKEI